MKRYHHSPANMRENAWGGFITVEDLLAWLNRLTDEDNAHAMLVKIDALKEELDE